MTLKTSVDKQGQSYGFFKLMSMAFLFTYICSLYVLSYSSLNIICNALFLGSLAFSAMNFLLEKKSFKVEFSFFALLLFVAYAALTTFWVKCDTEVMGTVITLGQLFGFYIIVRLNIQDEKDLKNIIFAIYIGAVIMCIYTVFYYGPFEIIRRISVGERIGDEINQMNGMGLYCTILFVMTLYFIIYEKKKWAIPVLPVSLFVLLGAGSRKSFLLVAFAWLLLSMFRTKQGRWLRVMVILSILVFAVYMIMELSETSYFFYRISQMFNLFSENESVTDQSINDRSGMIKYGLELFSKKPIQGYGPMQFEYYYSLLRGVRRPPHCTYIQVIVSFGLIGFVLFYGTYTYIISRLVPMIKKHRKYSILIITLILVFLVNDIGGNMLTHKFIYMFFGIYASYLNIKLDNEKESV
ncbi:MAG: O-antigen ligase family protein [Clostridia bacterium]|nr:O-antigen ligase family protein [Clostridia bacterium]